MTQVEFMKFMLGCAGAVGILGLIIGLMSWRLDRPDGVALGFSAFFVLGVVAQIVGSFLLLLQGSV